MEQAIHNLEESEDEHKLISEPDDEESENEDGNLDEEGEDYDEVDNWQVYKSTQGVGASGDVASLALNQQRSPGNDLFNRFPRFDRDEVSGIPTFDFPLFGGHGTNDYEMPAAARRIVAAEERLRDQNRELAHIRRLQQRLRERQLIQRQAATGPIPGSISNRLSSQFSIISDLFGGSNTGRKREQKAALKKQKYESIMKHFLQEKKLAIKIHSPYKKSVEDFLAAVRSYYDKTDQSLDLKKILHKNLKSKGSEKIKTDRMQCRFNLTVKQKTKILKIFPRIAGITTLIKFQADMDNQNGRNSLLSESTRALLAKKITSQIEASNDDSSESNVNLAKEVDLEDCDVEDSNRIFDVLVRIMTLKIQKLAEATQQVVPTIAAATNSKTETQRESSCEQDEASQLDFKDYFVNISSQIN